jgi:hypothetical protein
MCGGWHSKTSPALDIVASRSCRAIVARVGEQATIVWQVVEDDWDYLEADSIAGRVRR